MTKQMTVLMTGASGYVGRRVADRLLGLGHAVHAVVRPGGRPVPDGVRALTGDLEDFDSMRVPIERADAVIHCAFPAHGRGWAEAVAVEARFLSALLSALEGSDKPVVVSNGSIFLGDSGTGRLHEGAPVREEHPAAVRAHGVGQVTGAPGVRGVELRLASFVYGAGGSVFLPLLVEHARRTGRSLRVGVGDARASVVHVEAAADAYVAAVAREDARGVFHIASEEEPTMAQIARAVAVGAGPGTRVVTVDETEAAAALDPFTAQFLTTNNRLDATRARRQLGWHHAGQLPLLWDVAFGSYARRTKQSDATPRI